MYSEPISIDVKNTGFSSSLIFGHTTYHALLTFPPRILCPEAISQLDTICVESHLPIVPEYEPDTVIPPRHESPRNLRHESVRVTGTSGFRTSLCICKVAHVHFYCHHTTGSNHPLKPRLNRYTSCDRRASTRLLPLPQLTCSNDMVPSAPPP